MKCNVTVTVTERFKRGENLTALQTVTSVSYRKNYAKQNQKQKQKTVTDKRQ